MTARVRQSVGLLMSRQDQCQAGLQVGDEALRSIERHNASHNNTSFCQGGCGNAQVLNPSDNCRDVVLHFDGKPCHERTIDVHGLGKRYQRQIWQHGVFFAPHLCSGLELQLRLQLSKLPSETFLYTGDKSPASHQTTVSALARTPNLEMEHIAFNASISGNSSDTNVRLHAPAERSAA